MIPFIITPPFRRRFRPPRATDEMPVAPLVDVMLYWICSTFGGLFASAGLVALLGAYFAGVQFERIEVVILSGLAALAPPLFAIAIRSWRKLNRS